MKMIIKDSIVVYAGNVELLSDKVIGDGFMDTTTTQSNAFEIDATPPRWFAPGGFMYADGVFTATDARLAEIRAELVGLVSEERKRVRDAGFIVDGVLWDSDAAARLAYSEFAMTVQADPSLTTPWRASDGVWVTLDAALFATVYAAGRAHVEGCFAWAAEREEEIAACATVEDLAGVSVVFG